MRGLSKGPIGQSSKGARHAFGTRVSFKSPPTKVVRYLTDSEFVKIQAKLNALREMLTLVESEIDDHFEDLEAEIREEMEREG